MQQYIECHDDVASRRLCQFLTGGETIGSRGKIYIYVSDEVQPGRRPVVSACARELLLTQAHLNDGYDQFALALDEAMLNSEGVFLRR